MTDTSNADNSPDSRQDDQAPPPSSWTPPRGAPSPLSALAKYSSDVGIWDRGQGKTPDQPTTVAPLRPMNEDTPPPRPPGQPPIGLSPRFPFPFRPKPIQRYFPMLPNRPWHQWGQAPQFGYEPQPWETHGIYQNVARYFSQQGSGYTAPTAALLGASTQGHSKAYIEGQSAALRVLDERMKINANALADKQDQEIKDYRDAFALGGGDVGTWSGDEKATLKGVGTLHDALEKVATKYQDGPMLAALESGNLSRAENILKERDARSTDLRAANAARARASADEPYKNPPQTAGAPSSTGADQPDGYKVTPNGIILNDTPQAEPQPPKGKTAPAAAAAPTLGSGADDGTATADDEGLPPADDGTRSGDDGLTGDAGDGSDIDRAKQLLSPQGGEPTPPAAKSGAPLTQADLPSPEAQPAQATAPGSSDQFQPPPGDQQGGDITVRPRAQPQPSAWQPTPSRALLEAKNGNWNVRSIDDIAQEIVAGRAKASDYSKNDPALWSLAQQRAREIKDDLQRIRDSNLQGDAVVGAVHRVAPNVASDLKDVIDGAQALPTSRGGTISPYSSLITQFAHKARPTWAPSNFTNMAQFSNPNGRTQLTLQRAQTMTAAAQNLLKDINVLPDDPNRFKAMMDFYKLNGYSQDPRYQRVFADWQAFAMESNVLRTGGTGSVTETEQMIQSLPLYASKQQYRAVVQRDIDVAESNIAAKRSLWGRFNAGNPNAPSMPGDDQGADQVFGAIRRMNIANGYIPGDVPASMQGAVPQSARDAEKLVRDNINSADPARRAKALQIQQWLTGEGQ